MTTIKDMSPLFNNDLPPMGQVAPPWSPWTNAMERFMGSALSANGEKKWAPSVDVSETDKAFVFKAEIPGVSPEDIKVNVTSNGLTISGEKSEEEKTEGDNFVQTERRYGSFQRAFAFSNQVDPDDVKAEAKHGILTVTLKKAVPSKANSVKVQSS